MKLASKRVFLFTNNDDPHETSLQLQRQTKTKAKDMVETGIELELLHLPPSSGARFNVGTFFQDVLGMADDLTTLPDPSERLEELLTR